MTKIENNQTLLHVTAVQACSIFDTPVTMIEKLAQKNRITFITDIKLPPELYIMADKQHISQILMNLLSNAVKFTPEKGTVRLSVEISDETSGDFIRITVSDTGIGMSEEFVKNLYTPFEQENITYEGTGLGLSIAKKLVELMDGTIDCVSTKNVGTSFTVTLPLVLADTDIPNALPDSVCAKEDLSLLKGKHVLVCEDNEINALIIKRLLERVGLAADIAENGRQGVELFSRSEPMFYSIILMDIRMPVMDGHTATKVIRDLPRPDAKSVPIIAMTADAFEEDKKTSLAAGMDEHLSKPVEPKKLYDTLIHFIKQN